MQEYLHRLEDALAELKRLRDQYTLGDLKRDRLLEWALRYGLLESIQIIIDIIRFPGNHSACEKARAHTQVRPTRQTTFFPIM
ncbi:hypothetical protein [Rhodothermus marinus]|uniref:hypothetical protein n=1 Tax=Rhodothermus marinus TaxID=29549 RepID=UPI0001A30C10|nr:hypothetical protein [Rhodothermus marinus]